MVKPINDRRQLANKINEGREGDRVLWSDLPRPQEIVARVMRLYRRFEDNVGRIPCLLGKEIGRLGGVPKYQKLVFIGSVDRILKDTGKKEAIVLKGMFPPGGKENPMVEIRKIKGMRGLSQQQIQMIYNRAVVTVAPEFYKKGLYVEIDKLGDLSTDRILEA